MMTGCDSLAWSIQPLAPPILFFKDKRKAPSGLRPSIATTYSMGGPLVGVCGGAIPTLSGHCDRPPSPPAMPGWRSDPAGESQA